MRITPLDILQKRFQEARRGLDPEEVRAFLDQVRESMEELLRENQRHREEIARLNADIDARRAEESDLKATLSLARRVAEDMERGARREADVIVGEARLEAERILATAAEERRGLQEDVIRLRTSRVRLESELRAVVEAHGRLLDELGREARADR